MRDQDQKQSNWGIRKILSFLTPKKIDCLGTLKQWKEGHVKIEFLDDGS